MTNYFLFSGLIVSIWMFFGVWLAARFYPNYSQIQQFCSELGASGSPTEKLSPAINNYPLGILFCLFGIAVIFFENEGFYLPIIGTLIIVHGIATWVAGYFPMDKDAYTTNPTVNCQIHSWAGLVMLLSLLIAQILALISPGNEIFTTGFKLFSITSCILTIYFLYTLKIAYLNKDKVGLHQRLGYATQLIWLSGLASWLIVKTSIFQY